MASLFAIDRKAVLNFFNPIKTEKSFADYVKTCNLVRDKDQHSIKCLRTIYLVLIFQSILQVYLYLFPSPWHRFVLFNIFDQSNNYPNIFKLNIAAVFLMSAYMFYILYVCNVSAKCFQLGVDYYHNNDETFITFPAEKIRKVVLLFVNVYQVFTLAAVSYLSFEYIVFTLRLFRSDSLLVWTKWIEFASMNLFFVAFASSFCLFIYISYTCIGLAVYGIALAVFRFRETHRPLALPYCRFTTLRLLRFVNQNIGTMQYIFSLNRLFGPILLAFMLANLPSNVMIAIYLLQNRLLFKQKFFMFVLLIGQLTCFIGVHPMAANFSKNIHHPYKRIQSLSIRIRRCPLRARIHLAMAIQTFDIKDHKYGITYGAGKWTFGLVTIMSFTKFMLLYGYYFNSRENLLNY